MMNLQLFITQRISKRDYSEYNRMWEIRLLWSNMYILTHKIYRDKILGVTDKWLTIRRSDMTLPEYIMGKAKGTIIEHGSNFVSRNIRIHTIFNTRWGPLHGHAFTDDVEQRLIDLNCYPVGDEALG